MTRLTSLLALVLMLGCSGAPQDASDPQADHEGHDAHAGRAAAPPTPARLVPTAGWEGLKAGRPATLSFHLESEGKPVHRFELLHERKMHFILVGDALDAFQHLHPDVDADGAAKVEVAPSTAGRYWVYVDFEAQGGSPQTARHEIRVDGDPPAADSPAADSPAADSPAADSPAADSPEPDVPGRFSVEGMQVEVAASSAGGERRVIFAFQDAERRPVTDLQPYLGALGHLVVVAAADGEYVHAHPETSSSAADGRVAFSVHFSKPGIYKAWGQFRRADRIVTVPIVLAFP